MSLEGLLEIRHFLSQNVKIRHFLSKKSWFRVMSQKKWQICALSWLHILCHSVKSTTCAWGRESTKRGQRRRRLRSSSAWCKCQRSLSFCSRPSLISNPNILDLGRCLLGSPAISYRCHSSNVRKTVINLIPHDCAGPHDEEGDGHTGRRDTHSCKKLAANRRFCKILVNSLPDLI